LILLAADVGEGGGADELLLPMLDAANVCCGAHAGSAAITAATALRCTELLVKVGAHPGYQDRANFGRAEVALTAEQIEELLEGQVATLAETVRPAFLKPHGALYHRCQTDAAAAAAAARVARRWGLALVGQPEFGLVAAALELGVPAWREGYADRGYRSDGSLVPRQEPGAVLDPNAAGRQALTLARSGRFDVICLHGDSPAALDVAAAVRRVLPKIGA